jgi:replicative DNA helicase
MKLGQPFRVLRSGTWDEKTGREITKAVGEMSESNIYYFGQSDSGDVGTSITTQTIYATARYMKMAYGLAAIVVDYLQAVGDSQDRKDYERVSNISRRLQAIAKGLQVPVIALCQLNREASKRESRRPRINDLRGSGNIEYDADVILLVYRDAIGDDDSIKSDEAEIEIGKQRQSDRAKQLIRLKWDDKKHIYYEDEKEIIQEGWWNR